jgi:hypothetical protein
LAEGDSAVEVEVAVLAGSAALAAALAAVALAEAGRFPTLIKRLA